MDPLAKLAKDTIENRVLGKPPAPPQVITPEMKERAGVFVSIKKLGELRGCIGTFEPTKANVAEEIISNSIASATRDPRFSPVKKEELMDLSYSVDVLTKAVEVFSKDQLDPKKYGVIVQCGWRRGLLLPDLEGVDTVEEQIEICRRKAGISPVEPVRLFRFEVNRHS
ncbi:MAG: AmmeMemoRadiSam system protein A [Dehalococcoidia bacterium]|nr:AmmeMemoRadiSam system protein A [Dehalococcoidia bacterium]MDZ4247175.1 AmmeMemoRadiSam system protein A [Dehalococcoidia bacterium]